MKTLLLVSLFASLPLLAPAPAQAGGGGRHHGPPPAAFDACKGKAEGDACTFEGYRGTINGTCRPARRVEALVCRHPHRGQ